jgi:hypothetical protein
MRSVAILAERYRSAPPDTTPTRSRNTLEAWSKRYDWPVRAELYDRQLEDAKNARAAELMQSGLALAHNRVAELNELYALLKGELWERGVTEDGSPGPLHNLWLPDVKVVGAGDHAETVEIERFNEAIIRQLRGTLEDIAAEVGGRVKKQEVSGRDGGPIEVSDLTEAQIVARIEALLSRARERRDGAGAAD